MYNNLPKTLFIGKSVIYLPTCHSTNEIASSLLGKPEIFEGTVVITSSQTAGKGQRGNKWEAEPDKNLTFSVILKPDFLKINQQFNLNIAISLAVYDFLTKYLGEKVKIKWPNDVFVVESERDKKICGILIQNTIRRENLEHAIAGIGININQENFSEPKAASLKSFTHQSYDLEKLFREISENIERRYLQLRENGMPALLNQYHHVLYWYRQRRTFKAGGLFKGEIIGIDELGRLMIDTGPEVRVFNFKEVEFVE